MRLNQFVDIVKEYEKNARWTAEETFWEVRANLNGNFLAYPLDLHAVEKQVHKFLGMWRSYRHVIDWIKLVRVWTPEMQSVASS